MLGILTIGTFFLWQCDWFSNCTNGYQDLGLNGLSEVVGILFTLYIIEKLIKRKDDRKLLPYKIAVYSDIVSMVYEIIYLWGTIYSSSVPNAKSIKIRELFTEEVFKLMGEHLDLDSPLMSLPTQTWRQHIPLVQGKIRRSSERIIQVHSTHIDPHAMTIINRLLDGYIKHTTSLIDVLPKVDAELGIQRHSNLRSYLAVYQPWLNDVIELHEWCSNERKRLMLIGAKKLRVVRQEYIVK